MSGTHWLRENKSSLSLKTASAMSQGQGQGPAGTRDSFSPFLHIGGNERTEQRSHCQGPDRGALQALACRQEFSCSQLCLHGITAPELQISDPEGTGAPVAPWPQWSRAPRRAHHSSAQPAHWLPTQIGKFLLCVLKSVSLLSTSMVGTHLRWEWLLRRDPTGRSQTTQVTCRPFSWPKA